MASKNDYVKTDFPGIKQRLSDGKYIVTLDLGRQRKVDKKTGEVKLKQVKTTRVVSTLKEAKALQGANNKAKKENKITGTTGKVYLRDVLQDYYDFYQSGWGDSHRAKQASYIKRLNAYFADADIRQIDVLDVEKFFKWCQQKNGPYIAISNNTIQKVKSTLLRTYKFAMKNPNHYGVRYNPAELAEVGKIDRFQVCILTVEQVNDTLSFMLNNEKDTSVMVLWGLACLSGLRRGEICGLQWGDIDWKTNRIYVSRNRIQVSKEVSPSGWKLKCPKNGNENGRTPEERRERWVALPTKMAYILDLAKRQQQAYSRRNVTKEDYVYRSKVNLVNNYLTNPGKLDKSFTALQNRLNRARRLAGKEEIHSYRLHDLRHTHISICLNEGVNPFQVSASAGHKITVNEYGITGAVYWHDNGDRSQIVECMDRIITVPMEVFDEEDDLMTRPENIQTNRPNLRNDEI